MPSMEVPKLKVKVKTIREVSYFDLERWLEQVFGMNDGDVSLVADNEWNNDSQYTIHIQAPGEAWTHGEKEFIDIEHGEGTHDLLMFRLANKIHPPHIIPNSSAMLDFAATYGLIEPGEYTVDVMW